MSTSAKRYDPRYLEGIRLFNERRYWHAHEAWEAIWRSCRPEDRRFYQGLIQAAASLYHVGNGNERGAIDLGRAGLAKLAEYPSPYLGLDLIAFRQAMEGCLPLATPFVGPPERFPILTLDAPSELP